MIKFRTDDYIWLNYLVTKFRAYIYPLLSHPFDAEEIIPGLYLGSFSAALCHEGLKEHKIEYILSTVDVHPIYPNDFDYKILPYRDSVSENILSNLDEGVEYINESLKNGNVLVHCFYGVSRSSSLIIAYLIKHHGHSFDSALKLIKEKRPIANPNQSFRTQLKGLNKDILKAWCLLKPLSDEDELSYHKLSGNDSCGR